MTQSPRHGEAAPVDIGGLPPRDSAVTTSTGRNTATTQPPANGTGQPGGWSSTALDGKLPRPDTPTDTVPVVRDQTVPPASNGSAKAAGASGRKARARGPRRARLQLRHINPWTVLKFSCVLAVALFFVWLIMIGVLYGILDATGVISRINDAYLTLKSDGGSAPITAGTVFGAAAIIGIVDIVLFIALSTIGSVVYNLCADLVGGVEVTLSER